MNQVQATNAVSDGIQQRAIINQVIGARWFLGAFILPCFLTAVVANQVKDTWLIGTALTVPSCLMASRNIKKLRS